MKFKRCAKKCNFCFFCRKTRLQPCLRHGSFDFLINLETLIFFNSKNLGDKKYPCIDYFAILFHFHSNFLWTFHSHFGFPIFLLQFKITPLKKVKSRINACWRLNLIKRIFSTDRIWRHLLLKKWYPFKCAESKKWCHFYLKNLLRPPIFLLWKFLIL